MSLKDRVNESNCNKLIDFVQSEQNRIGKLIDSYIVNSGGEESETLNEQYEKLCDTMDYLCEYRRTHNWRCDI